MSPQTEFPKKLFYKINEVAKIVGVEDYVLRYWETRFPMLKPEKQRGDQRRYRQKDIELLLKIQELVHVENHPIEDAVEMLKRRNGAKTKSPAKIKAKPTPPKSTPETLPTAHQSNGAAPSKASEPAADSKQPPPPAPKKPAPKSDELRSILEELEALKNEFQ